MHFVMLGLLVIVMVILLPVVCQCVELIAAGVRIEKVAIFNGRPIARFALFGWEWQVGWIPLNSSISYDPEEYAACPLARRLLIRLTGPLILFAAGALVLGIRHSALSGVHGIAQFVQGALHPATRAVEMLARFNELGRLSLPVAVGKVMVKAAFFNLAISWNRILVEIKRTHACSEALERVEVLVAFASMAGMASWAFAIVLYLLRG